MPEQRSNGVSSVHSMEVPHVSRPESPELNQTTKGMRPVEVKKNGAEGDALSNTLQAVLNGEPLAVNLDAAVNGARSKDELPVIWIGEPAPVYRNSEHFSYWLRILILLLGLFSLYITGTLLGALMRPNASGISQIAEE
jgi:hypothetical protein